MNLGYRLLLLMLSSLMVTSLSTSCTEELPLKTTRHLADSDIIITDNSVSLAFDRATALNMGIPAFEYDSVAELFARANKKVQTKAGKYVSGIQDDWSIAGAFVLNFNQHSPTPSDYTKYFPTELQNHDLGIEWSATSPEGGSHQLLVIHNTGVEDLNTYTNFTYYYQVLNVNGPVTFVYNCTMSGHAAVVVFSCPLSSSNDNE